MRVLGVDPGISGALAVVADGRLVECVDMPVVDVVVAGKVRKRVDAVALAGVVRGFLPVDVAVLELVSSRPTDGRASAFVFGFSAGLVEGVLAGCGVRVVRVVPSVWKRRVGLPVSRERRDGKVWSRALASVCWGPSLFRRVRDDGRAEAALLALAG